MVTDFEKASCFPALCPAWDCHFFPITVGSVQYLSWRRTVTGGSGSRNMNLGSGCMHVHFFFNFYFYFILLYNTVLVLPYIDCMSIVINSLVIFCVCMHAKLLQSCPTLCDPMDCSPPGSPVHETLQARMLEWVTISFSR